MSAIYHRLAHSTGIICSVVGGSYGMSLANDQRLNLKERILYSTLFSSTFAVGGYLVGAANFYFAPITISCLIYDHFKYKK